MTTFDTAAPTRAAREAPARPSLAMAVLTAGLLLCVAGYAALALLVLRAAAALLG